MKLKLTKPGGFFTSQTHVIIDSEKIETVEDNGNTRNVVLHNGKAFEVVETIQAIDKLMSPDRQESKPKEKDDEKN